MKDKSCKKSLHGIILGHPDGGVLVRTERTMKMSLQSKSLIDSTYPLSGDVY